MAKPCASTQSCRLSLPDAPLTSLRTLERGASCRRPAQLELLCQALQPEVPGLSVVCGALQGRRWDAACMELDPLTCPLPTTPPLDQ